MITAYLNDIELPRLGLPFIKKPLENAVDIVTLDNSIYTSHTSNFRNEWTLSYAVLTQAEYDVIYDIYMEQFTENQYPTLSIPYYEVEMICRMYINEKDIWNNCGSIQNVTLQFRESREAEISS